MNIGCVLMAAGLGVRFGGPKLLHPIKGRPMLAGVLDAAAAAWFARAVAIVSDERVARLVRAAGYQALLNPHPEDGQGRSAALGAGAMRGLDAALFCTGDQPYLTGRSVRRLLDAWRPGDLCVLSYDGVGTSPVLFPAGCMEQLASLAPGQRGRDVLRAYAGRVRLIPADSARELLDIDTPGDLAR